MNKVARKGFLRIARIRGKYLVERMLKFRFEIDLVEEIKWGDENFLKTSLMIIANGKRVGIYRIEDGNCSRN